MIDWTKGYSASYHLSAVDANTWRDLGMLDGITGGSIKHTDSSLIQSADIDCVNYIPDREQWIRIWLDIRQDGSTERVPLFTGLSSAPSKKINGYRQSTSLQCYSVLKPAEDVLLEKGWYAPSGISGASLCKKLLSVTKAPIVIESDSPALQSPIVSESGETNLTMCEKILIAIGWRILIAGDGTITICPPASEAVVTFETGSNDVIEPSIDIDYDWYSCPNVLRVTMDDESFTYKDEDADSMVSIINRGREIWAEESDCNLNEGESLERYAKRRLKELQQAAVNISYDRRYNPGVDVTDLVVINLPEQEISGYFMVKSQSITLGAGAKVSEEVIQV